jgi:very-short-patch-repair endonuclease
MQLDVERIARDRISRLFRYISAWNDLGNPPKRLLRDQLWHRWFRDFPDHPCVQFGPATPSAILSETSNASDHEDSFVLKVRRPTATPAPQPPAELSDWIKGGWQQIDGRPEVHTSRNIQRKHGETALEQFDADPKRCVAFQTYRQNWEQWAFNERPTRAALTLFENLYELHGQIEREAEKVELILGDGVLTWARSDGDVFHPLILQRVQLEFDAKVPEFTVVETEHPVELYSSLLRTFDEVDANLIKSCRAELEAGNFYPFDGQATTGYLRGMAQRLSAKGRLEEGRAEHRTPDPLIWRDPVIFMRTRNLGFAAALDAILEQIESGATLPTSLFRIVGAELESAETPETRSPVLSTEDVLLSKPANPEQLQIAQRLEEHGAVLVQGPPGTGKTHTIANLLGHLLAQGKTVLVTSHTTKALRVLREKVVPALQPLCVSVLESDSEGKKQLESAVNAIVERLAHSDATALRQEAEEFLRRRAEITQRLQTLRLQVQQARHNEYRDVVVDGQAWPPSEGARLVAEGRNAHSWVPSPVQLGAPLPVAPEELSELYQTNISISLENESEMRQPLPDPANLPTPSDFEGMVCEFQQLQKVNFQLSELYWPRRKSVDGSAAIEQLGLTTRYLRDLANQLQRSVKLFMQAPKERWRVALIAAGTRGGEFRGVWDRLIWQVQALYKQASVAEEELLQFGPQLVPDMPASDQHTILRDIHAHLTAGNRLGFLTLLTKRPWRTLLRQWRVNGRPPKNTDDFHALSTLAALNDARQALLQRWERSLAALGAPIGEALGGRPELTCHQFVPELQACLEWNSQVWTPLEQELKKAGFSWSRLLAEIPPNPDLHGDLLRIGTAVVDRLPACFDGQLQWISFQCAKYNLRGLEQLLGSFASGCDAAPVARDLLSSVQAMDSAAYTAALQRLRFLTQLRGQLDRRDGFLQKLRATAPAWATAVARRTPPHNQLAPPGNASAAWLWRQLEDELSARNAVSISTVQVEIEALTAQLFETTSSAVDRLAWASQIKRTSLPQRQALMGWLQTIRRIGKGNGKRVPMLRADAQEKMNVCRSAVPVWIMPLARVVENFRAQSGLFDVVIIDEASQSDILGLTAFYLGKRVVVVGDHEQVSPDAVGQDLTEVQRLIDEYLEGIPNAQLFDGQISVYDLGLAAFGGTICLREHFRCATDIIQFSNHLSYDGKIKPLRNVASAMLKPHTIAFRVLNGISADKVNRNEAETVASLLLACIQSDEYADKTFGVISLVGDEQARLIESILRRELPPTEFEKRRIICGNPAHFQGDERDVIFLSMVDGPGEGPLALRESGPRDMYKKRYNVAASRAKDQLWVIHSLDPTTDLKSGDLRKRLIEHAMDPTRLVQALAHGEARAESEFERQVLQRLVNAGYRVTLQVNVGYYRIDLVVTGNSASLAVECDGDRYHPYEKLADDIARQAILERLGWRFVRVRGSAFFRDPDKAMVPVFARLKQLGIEPLGPGAASQPTSSELREKITRCAAEILRRWTADEDAYAPAPREAHHAPALPHL